jgi:hypothetical protein
MSTAIVAKAGIIGLPKVTVTGKGVYTRILTNHIIGWEPCEIVHKGKTIPGTKVYTLKGDEKDTFKVPGEAQDFDNAMISLNTNGGYIEVPFSKALGNVPMLALPSKTGTPVKVLNK